MSTRKTLDVIARTDATGTDEIRKRVKAFADAGANAILVDGFRDLSLVREMQRETDKPFAFNQIGG